jgi:hypothetical protein
VEDHPLTSAVKGLVEQTTGLKEEALELGDDEISESAGKIAKMAEELKTNALSLNKADAKEELEALAKETGQDHSSALNVMKDLGQSGSSSAGNASVIVAKLAERFPDNSQISVALKSLKVIGTKNAMNLLSGTTVDAADKTLSGASPAYNHFKDSLSGALPEDAGVPVVAVAEMFGPTDFILHATEFASK